MLLVDEEAGCGGSGDIFYEIAIAPQRLHAVDEYTGVGDEYYLPPAQMVL